MSTTKRLTNAFSEAIATKTGPADDWVQVGAGFLAEAIDHMDWLEKGNAEWRAEALSSGKQAQASRATARIAIGHLQALLNSQRTAQQSWEAEEAAREWLDSIGA